MGSYRTRIEPVSPASAGRLSSTVHPGKSKIICIVSIQACIFFFNMQFREYTIHVHFIPNQSSRNLPFLIYLAYNKFQSSPRPRTQAVCDYLLGSNWIYLHFFTWILQVFTWIIYLFCSGSASPTLVVYNIDTREQGSHWALNRSLNSRKLHKNVDEHSPELLDDSLRWWSPPQKLRSSFLYQV